MRARGAGLLLVVGAVLAGCGDADAGEQAGGSDRAAPPATSSTSATRTPGPADDVALQLAVQICTEDIAGPDALVSDAAHAARAGTRSVTEIAEAFRGAQDAVSELAADAEAGELPNLADALQDYADVLGRARVIGDVGLPEITDAREAINVACYIPAAD